MAITIKDVAEQSGVSVATVSNVLNNPDRVRVDTRERVREVIDRLGFVPNRSARQLVGATSTTLAFLVYDISNPFFADVAAGVEDVARRHGLGVFVCNSALDTEREDEYLAHLAELRVRGVLATVLDLDNPRLARLRAAGVPVVLVDRVPPDGATDWCSVAVDDVRGGSLAVQHLRESGHRSVAVAGGDARIPQVMHRVEGATRTANEHGVRLFRIETVGTSLADGRNVGERLLGLSRADRPSAVFCVNDLLALGLLQYLAQQGVRVPDDVAIVGYDDIDWASSASVPLTSVAQPRQQLGAAAAELLLDEAGQAGPHQHRQLLFQPELVVRASSRPAT